MNFVDEIQLIATAGDGGDGVVRWMRDRSNQKGGPAGGNGGRGGDVRIRAVRDINVLSKYRGNTTFTAGNGGAGSKNSLHGRDGDDVIINLPIGSVVTLNKKGIVYELFNEGEEHVILKGGVGGYGNEHFKGSRNVTPQQSTSGKPGERDELQVELKLIADIGLVGYPNAGKSSLLNAVTNAQAKVGDYAFTTLDPNLGAFHGYIIADIPGIIEGASEGRGLGHQFLRHISRTKTLIFCISVEQDDQISAFRALMNELLQHDPGFAEVGFAVVLTKIDLISKEELEARVKEMKKVSDIVLTLSILDDASIKLFADSLVRIARN